jgi:hypothetical protein
LWFVPCWRMWLFISSGGGVVLLIFYSEWKILNAAVLFLLFINDIVTDIKANIKLFADDTSLYVTVDTPQNTADIIKATRWDRSERSLSSHTKRLPDIPYCYRLNNNPLCHTRSKALLMCRTRFINIKS